MSPKQKTWYLRKQDGSEYGPVSTSDLLRWAAQSRILAGNGISADRETWHKVEDVPEIEMDWIAHRPDGKEYGPFNIAATRELHEHDVLPEDAVITHRTSGESTTVGQVLSETTQQPPPTDGIGEDTQEDTEEDSSDVVTEELQEEHPEPEPTDSPSEETEPVTQESDVEEEEEETLANDHSSADAEEPADPEQAEQPPGPAREDIEALQSELTAAQTEVEKLRKKLEQTQEKLKDARQTQRSESGEAEKTIACLTTERDSSFEAIASLKAELAALQRKHLTEQDSLTEEREQLQAELEAVSNGHKAAEASLARLEAERSEAEQKALQSMAELRKQTAFMKKNNTTLQSELEATRAKAAVRGKWLVGIVTILAVTGAAYLIIGPPSCRRSPEATAVAQDNGRGDTPTAEPRPAPPAPPMEERAITTPAEPPLATPTPRLEPWPTIMVEGIKVLATDHVCTLRFDQGAFSRLTTLSNASVLQLKEIANTLRPAMTRFQLIVQGHTDDKPLRNTSTYDGNYALGLARAEVVRKFLITEGRLPPPAVRAISAGEKDPPYPNDTATNRKRNRTVILKLVRK